MAPVHLDFWHTVQGAAPATRLALNRSDGEKNSFAAALGLELKKEEQQQKGK